MKQKKEPMTVEKLYNLLKKEIDNGFGDYPFIVCVGDNYKEWKYYNLESSIELDDEDTVQNIICHTLPNK